MDQFEIALSIFALIVTGLGTFLATVITVLFGILVWQMKSLTSSVQVLNEKVASIMANTERHDEDIKLIFSYIKEMQSAKASREMKGYN